VVEFAQAAQSKPVRPLDPWSHGWMINVIKLGNVEVNIEQNKKSGKLLPSWFPL